VLVVLVVVVEPTVCSIIVELVGGIPAHAAMGMSATAALTTSIVAVQQATYARSFLSWVTADTSPGMRWAVLGHRVGRVRGGWIAYEVEASRALTYRIFPVRGKATRSDV
jgi:hypothetical protein